LRDKNQMVVLRPVLLKTSKKHYRNGFVREKMRVKRYLSMGSGGSLSKLWLSITGLAYWVQFTSQISIGQYTNLEAQANLNNCETGQIN